ncbi:MAG: SGNH/GDSL hydrolase family protein [Oscillospiraceae bacterium]|nr:SGNH/GDSL hydrolase family protein [Oscillospiraceae bacterium]
MKKVVLLGDSIRLFGYGLKVPELLGKDFTVWQPDDNCRFSVYTLRMVMDFKDEIAGADVIHWNNGLWDVVNDFGDGPFTPVEVYVTTMKRIAKCLLSLGKKVIFSTITPVRPEYKNMDVETIRRYNAAVVPELEKMGIIINDLHSFVYPKLTEYITDEDYIHLSKEGIDAVAEQVSEIIRKNA